VVVVLGSANVDITAVVSQLPRPGETVSGGALRRGHGGKGANQAVAAARAGAAVQFVGAVGDDPDGDDVLAALGAEGIDVRAVRRVDEPTGTALICVDDRGENQIAVAPGANRRVAAEGVDLSGAGVALAQLEAPVVAVAAFFDRARSAGARTVLNAAPIAPDAVGAIRDLLDLVDVLVVNRHEMAALAGPTTDEGLAAAALTRSEPDRGLIVSLGPDGVLYVTPDRAVTRIAGHPVAAVDTVGAGDALCGAVAAALAEGRPIDEAVRRGNAAGALATTRPGARSSPTAAEVDALLREASPP